MAMIQNGLPPGPGRPECTEAPTEWRRAQTTEKAANSEPQAECPYHRCWDVFPSQALFTIPKRLPEHEPSQITLRGRKLPATFSPSRAPSSNNTLLRSLPSAGCGLRGNRWACLTSVTESVSAEPREGGLFIKSVHVKVCKHASRTWSYKQLCPAKEARSHLSTGDDKQRETRP